MIGPRLLHFLNERATRPFVWGEDDCSLFLADWWRAVHGGDDPAADLRGRYSDKDGKSRLVASNGGLLHVVTGIAMGVGASRTRTPVSGDFGLIHGEAEPVGAICAGDYWAFRNEQVGFIRKPRVIRAWSIL